MVVIGLERFMSTRTAAAIATATATYHLTNRTFFLLSVSDGGSCSPRSLSVVCLCTSVPTYLATWQPTPLA